MTSSAPAATAPAMSVETYRDLSRGTTRGPRVFLDSDLKPRDYVTDADGMIWDEIMDAEDSRYRMIAISVWAIADAAPGALRNTVLNHHDGRAPKLVGRTVVDDDGRHYPIGAEQLPACGHVDGTAAEYWSVLSAPCAVCEAERQGIAMRPVRFFAESQESRRRDGRCLGTNHRHQFELGYCDACGAEAAKGENGKVLSITVQHTDSGDSRRRPVCWAPHQCNPYRRAQRAIEAAAALADGKLVKGQTVIVVKGRKVAKGTVGVIRWIGEDRYNEGAQRFGLKVEGQDKLVYIAEANVAAHQG